MHPAVTTPVAPTAADAAVRSSSAATAPPTLDALLQPAAGVAPTLALLVGGWSAAADDAARTRFVEPLLAHLRDTDGAALDREARTAVEGHRAEQAATGVVALVGAIRASGAGLPGFLAGLRRQPNSRAKSPIARFDAFCAALTDVEMIAQAAARHARLARAGATVASRPTVALAHEQLAVQTAALGEPLATTPDGPVPADATAAWADAWQADDPRAGAACFAAAHAAQVVRAALGTPDVRAEAVHVAVARAVLRMAAEGRTPDARRALAAQVGDGPLAELVDAVGATPAPAIVEPTPLADDVADAVPVAATGGAATAATNAATHATVGAPGRPLGPMVTDVRFDAARAQVVLTLLSGSTVAIPASLVPSLAGESAARTAAVRVAGDGALLQWPELRLEVPVRGLLLEALDLSV